MKKYFLIAILFLIGIYGCAPKTGEIMDAAPEAAATTEAVESVTAIAAIPEIVESSKVLPFDIHQDVLENQLHVVTIPFDSPGLAAFYIVVRVGSRNEIEEGVTGFAHFFEHMMFRGTDRFSANQYKNELKLIGASANAYTTLDRTVYHMVGDAQKLETMFDLESDRFLNLKYSEHYFKTEAGAVKGEYTKNYASPYNRLYEKTVDRAFDSHTYKHTTMGFFKDVVDMPNQYEYSLEFFDRYYRPEYCTVLVVGDVSQDQVLALSNKYFGSWETGSYTAEIPVEPQQDGKRLVHLQDGSIPPFLELNYKGPAFRDDEIDVAALDILSSILFSSNSPLYRKLVVEEQKVRSISGGVYNTRDPYLYSISTSIKEKEDMQYVKNEIDAAVKNVIENGIDDNNLEETKSRLRYSYAMNIDSPGSIAGGLAGYISITGDPGSLNRTYDLYTKVTSDDIRTIASKYLIDKGLTIATISEDEEGGVQ